VTSDFSPGAAHDFEVLVVDDDASIREVLADFFGDRGLTIATAADGRAAMDALRRSGGRYGLVLTDVAMPGADGFAVLEAARAANPAAYVVMITGYASLETAISAVRAGAQDYLTKPFSLGQLDVMVRRASARLALDVDHRATGGHALGAALTAINSRLEAIERILALK